MPKDENVAADHSLDIPDLNKYFTPIDEAVAEIKRRQNDLALKSAVLKYLNHDLPPHFRERPIFYLSRHVATPNLETLRFIELCEQYDLPIVIGQDTEDIFVSNNTMKRLLGKMPIVKGVTHDKREVFENFTVIDFNSAQGKKFKEIHTTFGFSLVEFHNKLFRVIYPERVTILDDSRWISANSRGNLLDHYEKFLALLLIHGVMFENYEPEDSHFVKEILEPAFTTIESRFGYKPLICDLVPEEIADQHNWDSYPSVVYKLVKNAVEAKRFGDNL